MAASSLNATETSIFKSWVGRNIRYYKRYWTLYLLLLLPVVYFFIFRYLPMVNILQAFKENNIIRPVWQVSWAENNGFQWFIRAFQNRAFLYALRSTLVLNGLDLLLGFPAPIILAIILNELAFKKFKRITQTVVYMPHFLSWVIISGLALQLFNPTNGLINILLERMGMEKVNFLGESMNWIWTYVFLGIWQSAGWNTIIYLAAITSINPELYEAAAVDGAGRLRKIWHVTLPGLKPTIIVLLIMNLGRILGSDFDRPMALRSDTVSDVSDVISIFVYLYGLGGSMFSLTTAVGLFQSVVCVIFLLAANKIAEKAGERGIW
ncbi:MAG: ABC transporter permease subunit [Oscillospiraceae bacterium]|nr:ABC transporter permease subunit [Oscillospiraceae bacterium]